MTEEKGSEAGWGVATALQHSDRTVEPHIADVAPVIHTSSTFKAGNAQGLVYSRDTNPTRARFEKVLGQIENNGFAIAYSSGQAAFDAIVRYVKPRKILAVVGYHGVRQCLRNWQETIGNSVTLEFIEPKETFELTEERALAGFAKNPADGSVKIDLIHLEAPMNCYNILQDLEWWSNLAEKTKAVISVDVTFASPLGHRLRDFPKVRFIHHSCTKFVGGHSDVLSGAVVCKSRNDYQIMKSEQCISGAVLGSLESYLLLRSIRTLDLRFRKQSANGKVIAEWLDSQRAKGRIVTKVWHLSLESHPSHKLAEKYCNGLYPPCFGVEVADQQIAKSLPKLTNLFIDATSLGGVESMIDWRYKWDSTHNPPNLLRFSIGIEDTTDLIADLEAAFIKVEKDIEEAKGKSGATKSCQPF
jgi:cystathionine gamma-synthase